MAANAAKKAEEAVPGIGSFFHDGRSVCQDAKPVSLADAADRNFYDIHLAITRWVRPGARAQVTRETLKFGPDSTVPAALFVAC